MQGLLKKDPLRNGDNGGDSVCVYTYVNGIYIWRNIEERGQLDNEEWFLIYMES